MTEQPVLERPDLALAAEKIASRKRFADGAFLVALMVYILAGVTNVPIHADEFMFMSMAHDVFYMLHGNLQQIAFKPPVQPDTEQQLRLINGSINKTTIGLTWALSGRDESTLPGIYAWAMPLDWNRDHGNVPSDDALHFARWSSALFTALGVIPMFLLGWQLRLRSLAYPAALIYALHPVILLNGRRAMSEGSLMLTTLLTMYWLVTIINAEHSAVYDGFMRRLPVAVRYGILGLLAGLTVAAKYTGLVILAAALLGALVALLMRDRSWRPFAWVGLSAVVAVLTWFALNPVYWNDPIHAVQASIQARADLLTSQTQGPLVYNSVWDRLGAIVAEPFLKPPQYYEAPTWQGVIDDQIAAYQSSAWDGWDWGPIIGAALTILAIIGLATLIRDAVKRNLIAWVILIWAAAVIVSSLAIPLDWQRYYLPVLLVSIILAAAGLGRLIVRRSVRDSY